jgi:hypothetical protein
VTGSTDPAPGPGERRLDRPPSERYRDADRPDDDGPSPARGGAGLAVLAALGVALAITVAGAFEITAGLIAIAAIGGWAVAKALGTGGPVLPAGRRIGTAVALAVAGVLLGQLGLWAYARYEGGVLGPLELLAEVYGPLVLLELVAAAAIAWWTAR